MLSLKTMTTLRPTTSSVLRRKLGASISILAVAATTLSAPAVAQGEDGERYRITVANDIRTDVQRVAVAACYLREDIKTEVSQEALNFYLFEIDVLLDALRNGNINYGIPSAEERPRTLRAMEMFEEAWAPMREAAIAIRDGEDRSSNLGIIAAENPNVLEATERLVSEITGQYFNPTEMVKADSLLLEIAGRQRKLLLRISKESCMLRVGYGDEENQAALAGYIQIFDASLNALQNGMESAGIRQPPTPEIADGLAAIAAKWSVVKPSLDLTAMGEPVDSAAQEDKIFTLYTMLDDMGAVLELYQDELKGPAPS